MRRRKKLDFSVESRDSKTSVYLLAGDLFGTGRGYEFQEDVRRAVAEGRRRFVVDLAGVERIDSSGIGILAAVIFSTSRAGGGVVLSSLPGRVEQILGVAMLLDHVARAGSVDEALARLDEMDLA